MEDLNTNNAKFKKILLFSNELLKNKSSKIDSNDNIQEFYEILDFNSKFYNALGLSLIQVGIEKQGLVYLDEETEKFEFIGNPEILSESLKVKLNEGCLSLPSATTTVDRPETIVLKFINNFGNEVIKEFSGRNARIILHEIDHLNGLTLLDRVSTVKKDLIIKKVKKFLEKKQFSIFFKN